MDATVKSNRKTWCVVVLALSLATSARAIIFTNLHSFSAGSFNSPVLGAANGGFYPQASLLFYSNVLYGTATAGGSNNLGTVFAYSFTSGYANLFTFNGTNGAWPQADLVASGNVLYGTTSQGGTYNGGTVFAVNTNGTGFTNLFNFAFTNGADPEAGLVLSGGTLYGTTSKGGAYGAGTIFAISTDGTGFTNIYNFDYTNGANPEADLLLSGNTLYGTTANGGGSNGWGTVFAISTNGTGFTNLFTFSLTNGANPMAGLSLVGNVLCGTTRNGGEYGSGTVFSIATNGAGFKVIYIFGNPPNQSGFYPYSRLFVISNGPSSYTLYGTTLSGGNSYDGVVFSASVSGLPLTLSSYNVLAQLNNSTTTPFAGVVLSGATLYGTAAGSPPFNSGSLFALNVGGGSPTILHSFPASQSYAMTNSDGAGSRAELIASGNTLYGTASAGGVNGNGSIFAINTDGTGFKNLDSLSNPDAGPWAGLTLSGNTLYGTASSYVSIGPAGFFQSGSQASEIFALNTDGTDFTNLNSSVQTFPQGNLVLSGNSLFGTTVYGAGTVFSVTTNGTDFTNLYTFTGIPTGFEPLAGLLLSGNTLYGTTSGGGSGTNDGGTIFAINTDGTGFTNLFDFGGGDGYFPRASLILSGNKLYGTTEYGGISGFGTLFSINTDGSGFTNLYIFSGYDGANPLGSLVLCGNTLYGTTSSGGSGGFGTVFAINTDGTDFTNLYNFTGGLDGATPFDGLLLSGDTLYGTTSSGGSGGNGTVFALSLGPIPLCVEPAGNNVVLKWGNPAFSLQSAPTVNGPYTTISGAASPYTNAISASQEFFRLQWQ